MNRAFKAATVFGSLYFLQQGTLNTSNQPPLSMILRGQYENKIRRYSPPEKIFDVFASVSKDGCLYMTKKDLLKAICFFNYSISNQENIKNFEPESIYQLMGKNDLFQIYDYFILARYLSFDRWKLKQYMQEKGFTEITPDQYFELMINQVCGDYSKFIKTNILLESRQFKPSKQAYRASVKQTVQCLFKGKKSLKYEQLLKFRLGILRQLFEFEFLSFPGSQDNKIDGVDFARSIIKYIESSKRRSYLKRIVQCEQMFSIEIAKQSYIGFHLFMQTYLQELRNLLNQKGALTLNDIMNIVNKYSNKSERVEQGQIKVLMMLLDTDSSGFIEKRELLGVLNRLEYYTTVKSGETTLSELLWQDWEAIKSKLNKIKDILQE